MERKEFLSTLGISLAAVCIGCSLASCGSSPAEEATPDPDGGDGPGGLLTVNLDAEIKNTGEFKTGNGIILVRIAQTNLPASFAALQIACTHQGTPVTYSNAQGKFICPNHGSEFSTTGAVLQGPATTPLKTYTVTITGSTLTVSS